MVDLSLERPGNHHFVRALTEDRIRIADQWYSGSLVLAAQRLLPDWAPDTFTDITTEHFEPIFALEPDIVIIGTGKRQHFLPAELMMAFYGKGIGAEVMSTAAACRTFNVLVSEGRKVVAALLPPDG